MIARSAWCSLLLAAAVAVTCAEAGDDPSPIEQCEREAKGECCEDAACAADSLCDFDYLCSPGPGGGVQCSEPGGDRQCHVRCEEAEDGLACAGGGTCTMIGRAAGGDHLQELWACF